MEWRSIAGLEKISLVFSLDGDYVSAVRCGSGHINETHVVIARTDAGRSRFILQRINKNVFHDPPSLMENVRRVTEHLQSRVARPDDCLSLVATTGGAIFHTDEQGEYWRMYRYLEGTQSHDTVPSTTHAREAAYAFGRFLDQVRDLPGPPLRETIPGFHDTPARYAQLHEVADADAHKRKTRCTSELDWAFENEELAASLVVLGQSGDVPERNVHNDTKINNVMFDVATGRAKCVIDLDTVMPGLALYDFGDMVRSATMSAAEDEPDLSRVTMRMDYFAALADGFLDATADFLNEAEVENLAVSGKIIAIEAGVRFLVDYLSGDEYFRTHRPGQNLDRCRAQFALARSMDRQLGEMMTAIAAARRRARRS